MFQSIGILLLVKLYQRHEWENIFCDFPIELSQIVNEPQTVLLVENILNYKRNLTFYLLQTHK